ncbi:protein translocase subunit SecD [Photobacterium galatheae]|nr:protein translocase subunit SecD [Photobacterium galatheae]MCM0149130.1 protein translocase subunit SecD [Photobacterium galatheae]
MGNQLTHKLASLFAILIPVLLAISVFHPKLDFGLPKISYGIDLVGGGQIILQIDSQAIEAREIQALAQFFSQSHQLNREASVTDALVFEGGGMHPSVSDELINQYPTLKLSQTPTGVVVSGLGGHITAKTGEAVVENIATLRTRLNALGVADIRVYRQGSDKVVVEIPNGHEMERIKSILASSAEIGFYQAVMPEAGVMLSYQGNPVVRNHTPIASGQSITKAVATVDPSTGLPVVSIGLNATGGQKMGRFTKDNMGQPIVTTLTDSDYAFSGKAGDAPVRKVTEKVVSVATVNGQFSDSFIITGLGSLEESENLALILRSGVLTVPMYIVSESSIDSRLGAENANQGFRAFAIGLFALALYVIYLYRMRGVIAIFTLVLNAAFIVIALSVMGASFTMAGLAGIILTMGMAVDANIIVIEREKELFGKTTTPLADSFKSSALPILDANVTTLLVAVILYNVSSISLKGFAITLALGVVCTVLSSYFMNMYFSTAWIRERSNDLEPAQSRPS